MSNNDFEATVRGRVIKFPVVDGLTPLELSVIVSQVEEKIKAIEEKTKVVDTSKLAIMAAFDFAVELDTLKQRSNTNLEADTKRMTARNSGVTMFTEAVFEWGGGRCLQRFQTMSSTCWNRSGSL